MAVSDTIFPYQIHALWCVSKSAKATGTAITESVISEHLPSIPVSEERKLFKLAKALGFVAGSNSAATLTEEGERFSGTRHWRLWSPTTTQFAVLKAAGAAGYFLEAGRYEKRPVVVDLFAGAGGLSLGFQSAGFDVKVSVDNDPQACEAHRKNFPDCHVVEGDINELARNPKKHLCEAYGIDPSGVSGVIGGPPCQGFSFIGERVALDERNLLTSRFMDVVLGIEPEFFLMENVAGLASSGIVPKFFDYVRGMAKTIGGPASVIVDRLPRIPTSVAKRDRQYRKRLVSTSIGRFKEELSNAFVAKSEASSLADIAKAGSRLLSEGLERNLRVTYSEEGDSAVLSQAVVALEDSIIEIEKIAISATIEIAVLHGVIPETLAEDSFRDIGRCSAGVVRQLVMTICDEYDAAPKPTMYKGRRIGPILAHLIERASGKYDVSVPTVLNAAWYGAPQSRERLFVIGIHKRFRTSFQYPDPDYSIPGSRKTANMVGSKVAPTSFEAIGDMPDIDKYPELVEGDQLPACELSQSVGDYTNRMRLRTCDSDDFSLPRPSWNPYVVDCCNRTIHTEEVLERLRNTPEGIQEETSHKPRLDRDKVSNTLRAGTREGKGSHTAVRPVHYEYHRVISVREGARLMGYPDWMTFHRTKWHGFRLVGNGVPYPLGRAVAVAVKRCLESKCNEGSRVGHEAIVSGSS
jgi:site-specific DNA-cytosine methylase